MVGAHATLPVAKSDTIWVWLRIHSDSQDDRPVAAPRDRHGRRPGRPLRGRRLLGRSRHDADRAEAERPGGATTGQLAGHGRLASTRRSRRAPIWTAAGGNLDGFSINGVEFTQRGGEVEWGSFGKTDVNGLNFTYIGDDAPAGATLTVNGQQENGWPWQDVEGREGLEVPDFGTVRTGGVRRVGAIDGFRNTWTQPFLAADMAKLDEGGLSAFLAEVEGRLKATNDAVDLGFVRARSDIYRVRQIMLGADAASRLVTSPSLADLAARDEGARATSRGISEFLLNVGVLKGPGSPAPTPVAATPAPEQPAGGGVRVFASAFQPR